MRVSVIRDENTVNVDGVKVSVDCSKLDAEIHAVQWYGGRGEIEFAPHFSDEGWTKRPNQVFTSMEPYQYLVDAHSVEAARLEAERQQAEEAARRRAAAEMQQEA